MSSDEHDISNELAIAIANSVPSLRPHGSFTPEERALGQGGKRPYGQALCRSDRETE
jgi:hypothetical protein